MQNANEQQKFGEPLSDFSLRSLSGPAVSVSSKLTGKKGAVVVIWSSTCSHCIRYDKYFNSFEQRFPDLSLIIVSARHGETQEAVRKAAAQRKLSFCIVHDPTGSVAREWFTQQTPRAFLMDPIASFCIAAPSTTINIPRIPSMSPISSPPSRSS